ncbi:tyrosine-type recombinase/integrase [Sphingomonas bacterium]|uniref:tyrosine-type recombinase/integrase n=1 Tax=Sphingomonas bacterium TaxID=1895847 RepID=UPI0020C5F036|nr:tyrosine-type recombinase/integrase [Sphingomonas bacterium]
MLPRWTPVHAGDVLASLERDVFLAIGAMPIRAITAPVVLTALRSVEGRGRLETARRVRQRISGIFAFAMSEGLVDSDPAAIVGRALVPPPPKRNHAALLEVDDARGLLAAAELLDAAPMIKLASRYLALTSVRLAGVRGATWAEIEDLDGAVPIWRVPAARMKLAAAKKRDPKNDHVVPLARQAVAVLRAAGENGYDTRSPDALIFAGPGGAAIGEAAIGELYKRTSFAGRHVPHGWRATFSTLMNEAGKFDRLLIERALAHAPKDKVAAAYDRSQQLLQLRTLFQEWADTIDPAAIDL